MHYYFQASEGASPSTDPLTLWMNGGPGCTSLKGGFEELGQLVRVTPLPPHLPPLLSPLFFLLLKNYRAARPFALALLSLW